MFAVAAATLAFLACCVLGEGDVPTVAVETELADPAKYVVIIDAGSSGCRAHVFEILAPLTPGSFPSFKLPQPTRKEKPGLSTFADKPEEAGASLVNLVQFTKQTIPEKSWSSTVVLLAATAGLRRLPLEIANRILESCRIYIANNTPFVQPEGYPKLMSGRDEGSLGWLAANFLSKTLDTPQNTRTVLELGGASAQVTVALTDADDTKFAIMPLSLGNRQFSLYTHSYLNYGQEAARERYNLDETIFGNLAAAAAITEVSSSESSSSSSSSSADEAGAVVAVTRVDPCLPKGYSSASVQVKSVFSGPATMTVVGGGDFAKCREAVYSNLFKKEIGEPCTSAPKCSFSNIPQPEINSRNLLAFENFFYTTEGLGLLNTFSVDSLSEKGSALCGSEWAKLVEAHGWEDAERWCFAAAFETVLLHEAWGVDKSKALDVKKKVDGINIDWALGAAVMHVMNHADDYGDKINPTGSDMPMLRWVYGMVLLVGLIVITFATLHRRIHNSRTGFSQVPLEDLTRADLKSV